MKSPCRELWPGDWPHAASEGVGVYMRGYPIDSSERFALALARHGCHPAAGHRIFEQLSAHGEDTRTISYSLDFFAIYEALSRHGIELTLVAPRPDWQPSVRDGAWPVETLAAIGH